VFMKKQHFNVFEAFDDFCISVEQGINSLFYNRFLNRDFMPSRLMSINLFLKSKLFLQGKSLNLLFFSLIFKLCVCGFIFSYNFLIIFTLWINFCHNFVPFNFVLFNFVFFILNI